MGPVSADDLALQDMIRQTIKDEHFRSGRSITKEHLDELVKSEYLRAKEMRKNSEDRGTS